VTTPGPGRDPEATETRVELGDVLPPGTRLGGRYRVLGLAGFGGMGRVYRAHDEELDLTVALKLLRADRAEQEEFRERFRRELVLARQVSHRNVVRIHDLGFEGDLCFLTMDYVAGRSLREVLEREGPLELDRAVHLVGQLLEALAAAHEEGVVHRDLKPSNLLLDDSDRLYVSDFGLARSIEVSGLTGTGWVMGTLSYLSPEQARGEPADHRSDLYAVGLVFFEMLTGRLPFQQGSLAEVLAQRMSGHARTLGEEGVQVPDFVDAAIRRCLQRDPAQRYSSAREMARDLEGRRTDGAVARWRRRAARRLRRVPAWAAALLTVVILTVLALGLAHWLGSAREPPGGEVVDSGATTPAAQHSVAVLPLVDETDTEDLAWTSRGVADTLTAVLAESPVLRVVDSPRVVRTLEDLKLSSDALPPEELRLLADLLEVDRLVLGRVRSVGEGVQIELRLVTAGPSALSEGRLRAQSETEAGIFALVEDLGSQLRERLQLAADRPAGSPLSASPAALSAYSRGMDRLLVGDHVGAVPRLEEAVAEDRGFTAAWLRLAEAYEALGRGEEALEAARQAQARTGSSARVTYEAKARAAALAGEPERAREMLAELVEHYPHDVEARVKLAESYGDEGRYQRAEEILREVVEEDPNHPRAWTLLGVFAVYQGHYRQAVDEFLVRALVIQNRLGNLVGKARVLNAMGAALQGLGDLDAAAERYREAAELRSTLGDAGGHAATLANLASLEVVRGDLDAAREHLERALQIRQEIGDRAGMASLENLWGGVEEQAGDYRDALEHYRRGLRLRQAQGDRRAEAESHYNVGFLYYVLGEYDNAEVHWNEALRFYRDADNEEGAALTLQGIGQLQLARGDWTGAQRSFLEALEVSRVIGVREAEAVSHGYLGKAAQYQGRYAAALTSFRSALTILEELGAARGLTEFHLLAAAALLETGRLAEAKGHLEAARDRWEETGNREQEAELLRLEGETALAEGRTAAARESLDGALEAARTSGSRAIELWVRLSVGEAELAAGGREAVARLREVAREAERLGHVPLRLAARTALARAWRAAGDPAAAEKEVRDALGLALTVEPYGDAYRLHGLLAEILGELGRDTEAAEEWALAARAVERVREHLEPESRETFERLPEVRKIVRRHPGPAE